MRAVPGGPLWLRCAALLVLAAGLFAPSVTTERKVFDVLAVLDITGSMNVRDQRLDGAEASRLAMEKRAVRHLLAALPCGSRLGVAIFVEKQPFLLFEPVETCGNFSALDEEIAAIDWRMGWDSESHIAEAVLAAMKIAGGLDAFLVFMTDGQETPPLWWSGGGPSFAAARGSAHGLIVGVGGYQLVPIPKFDGYGREIGVFKPGDVPVEKAGMFRGREHLSAVDEPHVRTLASSSGLTYLHLDGPDAILPALTSFAKPRQFPQKHSITWMFALASLALLAGAYGFGLSGRLGPDS
jgi:mxaL protein